MGFFEFLEFELLEVGSSVARLLGVTGVEQTSIKDDHKFNYTATKNKKRLLSRKKEE